MCFAWISEQTAIISLYSNNLSVFITEAECLLRGTSWVFKSDRYSFVLKDFKCYCISNQQSAEMVTVCYCCCMLM